MEPNNMRMDGESRDGISSNIESLKKIFPSAVKENKVDFEALRTLLGEDVATDTGCYRMTWNGKEAARQFALKRSHGTLRPDRVSSCDWDSTQNVYIEGDNLEVLKLLQGGYYNSIKMIYIDPPYNTGKDFVYHDNFHNSLENYKKLTGQVDTEGKKLKTNVETSGRYHTDWLNMMFPRLLLAQNLLRDDGVIFISIDHNEIANLRKLCDEVFGEENFVNEFCWLNNLKGRQISSSGAATTYEYILCYAKCIKNIDEFASDLEWLKKRMPTAYRARDYEVLTDNIGKYVIKNELYNTNSIFNESSRSNLVYKIFYNEKSREVKVGDMTDKCPIGFIEILPHENNDGIHDYHAWRWSRDKVLSDSYDLEFIKDGDSYKIYTKVRDFSRMTIKNVIADISTGDLASIFDKDQKKVFDYSKPCDLIEVLLRCVSNDGIVLDFFSGSATTAHAVMQLNAKDFGMRQFIMVQLPEITYEIKNGDKVAKKGSKIAFKAGYENICEIGKERIRRAGDKVMAEWTARQNEAAGQLALDGTADATKSVPPDIGFRVFKLDTSNFVDWNPNSEDLTGDLLKAKDNVLAGRTKEDILYEVIVKCNFQLTDKIAEHMVGNNTIYAVRNGELMVCIDNQIPLEVGDEMLRLKHEVYDNPESFRAVFLDNGLSDDSKANIVQRLKGDGVDETCIRCV